MKQFVIRKQTLTASYGAVCSWTMKCNCCGFLGYGWSWQQAFDRISLHLEASRWCRADLADAPDMVEAATVVEAAEAILRSQHADPPSHNID